MNEIEGKDDLNTGPLSLDAWLFMISISSYMLVRTVYSTFFGLGVLTILCMAYLTLDVISRLWTRRSALFVLLKLMVIVIGACFLMLVPAAEQMACRQVQGRQLCAQDGLIQTEEAVRMLLQGRNPYTEDYFGTPLETAPFPIYPSPALYHLAYLPFTFLVHVPFAYPIWRSGGWYDGRVVYIVCLLLGLPIVASMAVRATRRLALVTALGLNLPLLTFTADGRNDILGLFCVLVSVFLASRGHRSLSMVMMALGCASKQTVWFALPFYVLYLLRGDISVRSVGRLARQVWPFLLTLAVVVGPFLLWDFRSFVDDTVLYLTGQLPTSYPLWGMGFGTLLRMLGLVISETSYVPFWIPQLILGLPVLGLLMVYQTRHNGLRAFWFGYAALQMVLGYFSRIFQDNYLIIIFTAFSFAFLSEDAPVASVAEAVQ